MPAVEFRIKEGVAYITLNRPDSFNSVDETLARELIDALSKCREDVQVRAILLTGAGKAFCAGQDLKEVTDPERNPGFKKLLESRYGVITRQLRDIEKPIVAAVNGVAAGAGANFALACDVVLASQDASFIQAFSAIGLIPDSGGTYFLPRLVGFGKASAFAMLGDKVNATEAERLGMIYRAVPAEKLAKEAEKTAVKLAAMPTRSLGMIKHALNNSMSNSFEQQLALEQELQIAASQTKDYHEGVTAFVEKRKPVFTGT